MVSALDAEYSDQNAVNNPRINLARSIAMPTEPLPTSDDPVLGE